MDENGDTEGNYTVIARKRAYDGEFATTGSFGLFPVGEFLMAQNSSHNNLPVSGILNNQ